MCLAVPAQVIALNENLDKATVSIDKVEVEVSLALVDDIQIGDYVLIHVGFALNKIDEDEALQTLALFEEIDLAE